MSLLRAIVTTCVGFYAAFALHHLLVVPVERLAFGDIVEQASLAYFPAGIALLCFYLWRYQMIPGLMLGKLLTDVAYNSRAYESLTLTVVAPLLTSLALPLVYAMFRRGGWDTLDMGSGRTSWLGLLVLVFVSSLISGYTYAVLKSYYLGLSDISLLLIPRYAIGDTVGAFVVMLVAMFTFRLMRLNRAL